MRKRLLSPTVAQCAHYEEFCDKYYASGYDIVEYTETVIRTLTEDEGESAEADVEADPASSLSSSDADYILSATTYDTTPHSEFERDPLYGAFVYDVIKMLGSKLIPIFFCFGLNVSVKRLII